MSLARACEKKKSPPTLLAPLRLRFLFLFDRESSRERELPHVPFPDLLHCLVCVSRGLTPGVSVEDDFIFLVTLSFNPTRARPLSLSHHFHSLSQPTPKARERPTNKGARTHTHA